MKLKLGDKLILDNGDTVTIEWKCEGKVSSYGCIDPTPNHWNDFEWLEDGTPYNRHVPKIVSVNGEVV